MGSGDREIAIVIRANNLADADIDAAVKKIKGLGLDVTGVGKQAAETGRLGKLSMWSFGESVGELAEQFGISRRAGNKLGDAVADIASKYGGMAMSLGVVSMAIGAGVMIYQHYINSKKEARDALDKMVDSLEKETAALTGNRTESESVKLINREILDVKTKLLDLKMDEKIKAETEELKKHRKEIEDGGTAWEVFKRMAKAAGTAVTSGWQAKPFEEFVRAYSKDAAAYRKEQTILADAEEKKLKKEKQQQKERHDSKSETLLAMTRLDTNYYNRLNALEDERTANWNKNFMTRETWKELESYNDQARNRIQESMYQATESQLLRLVEAHKFSVGAIGQAIAQQIKMELIGLAARAAVYSVYYLAYGLGLTAMGDPRAGAAFAAAAEFGTVAGLTLAAAAAVNAVVGPGGSRGAAGSPTGLPVATQAAPEASQPQPAQQAGAQVTVNFYASVVDDSTMRELGRTLTPYIREAQADGV